MEKISVIVPSYNSWPLIEKTLAGLKNQSRPELLEEVLVVDSSDDGKTKDLILRMDFRSLRLINAGKRVYPAAARNLGAAQAKSRLLAFIDADAYPADGWLESISRAYEQGCRIGGGPVLIPPFQRRHPVPLAQHYLQFNEFMDGRERKSKKFVPSCNLFCDKDLFDRLSGFPQIRASEDVLFGINAARLDRVWFDPAIMIYHIFRTSLRKFLANQKLLGEYIIRYRRAREAGRFYYRGYWPVILLPAFLLIKFAGITLRVLRLGPAHTLKFILVLPLFLLGLLWWGGGFIKGALSGPEVQA